jgi:hypothetical protein
LENTATVHVLWPAFLQAAQHSPAVDALADLSVCAGYWSMLAVKWHSGVGGGAGAGGGSGGGGEPPELVQFHTVQLGGSHGPQYLQPVSQPVRQSGRQAGSIET